MRTSTKVRAVVTTAVAATVLAGCAGMTAPGEAVADPSATVTETAGPETAGPATSSPSPSAPDGLRTVDVVPVGTVGSPGVVTAGGYVPEVIEVGGKCRFTITQGDSKVTGESAAEPDATTTWCMNVDLKLPAPGQPWELTLDYESPQSGGSGAVSSEGALQ